MTDSEQQKLHFLSEQVLNWSGLPVVHVRPTVFLEHPFFNMVRIRPPSTALLPDFVLSADCRQHH